MPEAVSVETLRAQLGEAVHTCLRTQAQSRASMRAHEAIADMPNREWGQVLAAVIDGLPKIKVPDVANVP